MGGLPEKCVMHEPCRYASVSFADPRALSDCPWAMFRKRPGDITEEPYVYAKFRRYCDIHNLFRKWATWSGTQ